MGTHLLSVCVCVGVQHGDSLLSVRACVGVQHGDSLLSVCVCVGVQHGDSLLSVRVSKEEKRRNQENRTHDLQKAALACSSHVNGSGDRAVLTWFSLDGSLSCDPAPSVQASCEMVIPLLVEALVKTGVPC